LQLTFCDVSLVQELNFLFAVMCINLVVQLIVNSMYEVIFRVFYLFSALINTDPAEAQQFPMEYLEKVKAVHSVGGYGSQG